MNPHQIKAALTEEMRIAVSCNPLLRGLVDKGCSIDVSQPRTGTLQVRITAPKGEIRRTFEITVRETKPKRATAARQTFPRSHKLIEETIAQVLLCDDITDLNPGGVR
jgi:hypothetical protein